MKTIPFLLRRWCEEYIPSDAIFGLVVSDVVYTGMLEAGLPWSIPGLDAERYFLVAMALACVSRTAGYVFGTALVSRDHKWIRQIGDSTLPITACLSVAIFSQSLLWSGLFFFVSRFLSGLTYAFLCIPLTLRTGGKFVSTTVALGPAMAGVFAVFFVSLGSNRPLESALETVTLALVVYSFYLVFQCYNNNNNNNNNKSVVIHKKQNNALYSTQQPLSYAATLGWFDALAPSLALHTVSHGIPYSLTLHSSGPNPACIVYAFISVASALSFVCIAPAIKRGFRLQLAQLRWLCVAVCGASLMWLSASSGQGWGWRLAVATAGAAAGGLHYCSEAPLSSRALLVQQFSSLFSVLIVLGCLGLPGDGRRTMALVGGCSAFMACVLRWPLLEFVINTFY
jgi:hypothetical protein